MLPVFALAAVAGYYYGRLSLVVDARLAGERVRVIPRVYARPLTLRVGLTLSDIEVIQRLNDLGYTAARARRGRLASSRPATGRRVVRAARRRLRRPGAARRVGAAARRPRPDAASGAGRCASSGRSPARAPVSQVALDPPLLSASGHHLARAAPARAAVGDSRRTCSRPCWPSRTAASISTRASTRSASSARWSPTCAAPGPTWWAPAPSPSSWPATSSSPRRWPQEAQSGSAIGPPQAARAVHGDRARDPGHQGGGPRALPERGLPRPPRFVRAPRRRRGRAHLLRQGPVATSPRRRRRCSPA